MSLTNILPSTLATHGGGLLDPQKLFDEIWQADVNRITPLNALPSKPGEYYTPYICLVLSQINSNQHHLFNLYKYHSSLQSYVKTNPREFLKSRLPQTRTYSLIATLFDNYKEDQRLRETNTEQEAIEIDEFLDGILQTRCIQLLGAYLKQIGLIKRINDEEGEHESMRMTAESGVSPSLKSFLLNMWFQQYPLNFNNPDLSGFEHCVVGERNKQKVSGYHYWFKVSV